MPRQKAINARLIVPLRPGAGRSLCRQLIVADTRNADGIGQCRSAGIIAPHAVGRLSAWGQYRGVFNDPGRICLKRLDWRKILGRAASADAGQPCDQRRYSLMVGMERALPQKRWIVSPLR